MKHHNPIQISIPKPCSEDWNKMTPQEQGRFCDSSKKCVVDFTNFSDAELYQYLLENVGKKACGRFRPEQLNRPIQIPHQPHSQLYKWIIAAGLALVLTATPDNTTFARVPYTSMVYDIASFNGMEKNKSDVNTDSVTIEGSVTDYNNDPVTNAVVTIMVGEKSIVNTLSDIDGRFTLKLSTADTADANIFVHYIGLREYMAALPAKGGSMNIKLEPTDAVGHFDIIIIEHDPPLINKFDGGHTKTSKSEEIEKGSY